MPTAREAKSRLRTAWELPDLIRPLHRPRRLHIRRPRLLPHYPAVVEFVYNHRFVTGFHIQRRFNDYMPTQRTSQYQLANLEDMGYLHVAPVRSTSPNFPSVFAATRRGVKLIQRAYASHGMAWQGVATEQLKPSGMALDSILHELLLTEFAESIRETVDGRGDLTLMMHERRYFQKDKQLRYTLDGCCQRLIPDAGFIVRLASRTGGDPPATGDRMLWFLVELDNGTLSTARIATKYAAYQHWSQSAEARDHFQTVRMHFGEASAKDNFRLLMIAHDKTNAGADDRRLEELFAQGLELPRVMRERIWLTTVAELRKHQHDVPPLATPMWLRLRDARPWLAAYHRYVADAPPGRGPKHVARQRRFIAARVRSLPRHSLFPARHVTGREQPSSE